VQQKWGEKKPSLKQTRASDNQSGGAMTINIEGAPMANATTSRDGAGNKSEGDMNIHIENKN
jgi:hypothetical protein